PPEHAGAPLHRRHPCTAPSCGVGGPRNPRGRSHPQERAAWPSRRPPWGDEGAGRQRPRRRRTMSRRRALARLFPPLRWRHLVTRANLLRGLAAGAIGALIVLPQGIAFATLAGLPPEYGLYAAMV